MECFKVKNIEFLKCLEKINRLRDIDLYRFIEKLIYGELSQNEMKMYKDSIKKLGVDEFLKYIKHSNQPKCTHSSLKVKRFHITSLMLENYVLFIEESQQFLNDLKLKVLLKIIPNKNIIVKNGEIVNIILND